MTKVSSASPTASSANQYSADLVVDERHHAVVGGSGAPNLVLSQPFGIQQIRKRRVCGCWFCGSPAGANG